MTHSFVKRKNKKEVDIVQLGFYVRCPLYNEPADYQYPRCFMLAQLKEYNEVSEEYTVKPYDILGTAQFYLADNRNMVYPIDKLERCAAPVGGNVMCNKGPGIILAHNDPTGDEPFVYYIKLDSGEFEIISELELEIEYTQMDYSPLKQLKNYEFQNPSWYANRIHVGQNMNFLSNSSYGFKTMAGCRVYLLPHQVSTVARCLELSPIRYMLADEVGLGKTIEACSIVKIMFNDTASLKVLFVVPGSLINQWRNELVYKFAFSNELECGNAVIVSMEDFISWRNAHQNSEWDILVIDETHRLLSNASLYSALLAASKETKNVLLLSATPIQDRKNEYHRLLTLLLPAQYENMSENRFSLLVTKQKKIQKSVNVILKRLDKFGDYEEDIIASINSISENLEDTQLKKMVAGLPFVENKVDQVEEIISYICENYRLERSVIRNRRGAITKKMPERTLKELHYLPCTSDDFYDENSAVESVIRFLSEYSDNSEYFVQQIAQPLLSSLFSSPWAFEAQLGRLHIVDDDLVTCAQRWKKQAEQELNQIDYILDEDPSLIHSRCLLVVDYMEQETDVVDSSDKIVVFTSFTETLHVLHHMIDHRLKKNGLYSVAFSSDMSRDDLENSVYDFQNSDKCKIIVCDETGGEGRNFQNAKMIIHIDLPWQANALEQRIGRLDRLGRNPDEDVLSVVVYSENTVEEQLFKIWRDGMQLFTHSLSGMEIITGELNRLISNALLNDYYNGLANALPEIIEVMERMRDAVEDEQQFDVGATMYRTLNKAVEKMLNTYLEGENDTFARAMLSWSNQAGLHTNTSDLNGLIQFSSDEFSTRAALQSMFAPPNWRKYENTPIMRRMGIIRGTFSRQLSIEHEDIIFFAPGDPVYESIASNAMGCGRGRCCAVTVTDTFSYTGFIFTYIAKPNIRMLIEKGYSPKILSQFRIFLPLNPITICVPLNKASQLIPKGQVIDIINRPYKLRNGLHIGQRASSSKHPSRLQSFIVQFPPDKWERLVNRAYSQAYEMAKVALNEAADLSGAKREIKRLIAWRRAESIYFEKDRHEAETAIEMYKTAWDAIRSLTLVLDSVCFLKVDDNG